MNSTETTTAAEPPVPAGQKRKGWWRRVLRGVMIFVAVVAAVWVVLDLWAEWRLGEVKKGLSFTFVSAKDLPTLWGPVPKAEDNAALVYEQIDAKLDALMGYGDYEKTKERCAEFDRLLVIWGVWPESWWSVQYDDYEAVKDWEKTGKKIPARDLGQAKKFLGQFDEVFKLREAALRRPGYRDNTDWSDWLKVKPFLPARTQLANLTLLQAAVAAEEGDWDAAYGEIGRVGAIARHLEQEPASLRHLEALSIRDFPENLFATLIHRHPPSTAQAAGLRELFTYDAKWHLRNCLVSECSFQSQGFDQVLSGSGIAIYIDYCDGQKESGLHHLLGAPIGYVLRPYVLNDEAFYLKTMGRAIGAAGLQLGRMREEMGSIEQGIREPSPWCHAVTKIICPAVDGVWRGYYSRETKGNMAQVAMGVAAYRQEQGKYPAGLGELAQADKLPRDPFTEKAGVEDREQFHYRRLEDGFVLWSVGAEGLDGEQESIEKLSDPKSDRVHVYLSVPPREKR